jgi:hypothetical protein
MTYILPSKAICCLASLWVTGADTACRQQDERVLPCCKRLQATGWQSASGTDRQIGTPLGQVREEAIMPGWRGAPLDGLLAACDTCATIGTKTDHYFETQESCDTCLFFAKPVGMQ